MRHAHPARSSLMKTLRIGGESLSSDLIVCSVETTVADPAGYEEFTILRSEP